MDVAVLIVLEVFALIPTIIAFMGKKAGSQLLCIFGAMISLPTALVLGVDGNLSSAGTTLAAANGNFISDFNIITMMAGIYGVMPLVIAARRIFHIW